MIGKRNSVLSRVHDMQPKVFSQGCVCHLALMAGVQTVPIDIDDLLLIYIITLMKVQKEKKSIMISAVYGS